MVTETDVECSSSVYVICYTTLYIKTEGCGCVCVCENSQNVPKPTGSGLTFLAAALDSCCVRLFSASLCGLFVSVTTI